MYIRQSIIIIVLVFLSFSDAISSQISPVKIKKKEFKRQELGFKEAWWAVKDGNFYYSKGLGSFRDARENYLRAYGYNPENAELNYMIGRCYLFTDNKFESIKYIEKAFYLKEDVHPDIHFMLGMAYHQILEFDKAIDEYQKFLSSLPKKYKGYYQSMVDQMIRQCTNGKMLVAEPRRVVINNLGKGINSVFDDYGPVIGDSDSLMYFTSRRMFNKKSGKSIIDNKYFEDIYSSVKQDKEWSQAQRLDKTITGKTNTTNVAVVGSSPNNKKLYIYKGKEKGGDVYFSDFKKGKWSSPKSMKKINTKYRELSVAISSDEKSLYFISSNRKKGYGGTDIYVCKKNEKNKWSKPENLGNVVNTFYDELGLNVGSGDSVLYFSSKGHNSMGGFDIFRTSLNELGMWSKPQNMGYPVNTPDDDVFYVEMEGGKTAYCSANRESGMGGMDIFKVIYLGSEKELQMADVLDLLTGVKPPYDIYFVPVEKVRVDTSLLMRGFITDSENQKPIIAKLELVDPDKSVVVGTAISDSTGNYQVSVPSAKKYGVEIVARGYMLYLDVVDLSAYSSDDVAVKNFQLDRVEVGAKVILKNIYFEFGKSTLKPESFTTLDNVVELLKNNETVRIEVSGHTDNIGSLKTNMKLSNDRAKAVVEYLMSQGIAADRLEFKGYAYTQPVAPNDTDSGRAQNRRVEFKILSK